MRSERPANSPISDDPALPATFRRVRLSAEQPAMESMLCEEVAAWDDDRAATEIAARDTANRCILFCALASRKYELATALFHRGARDILSPRGTLMMLPNAKSTVRKGEAPILHTFLLRSRGETVHPGLLRFLSMAAEWWKAHNAEALRTCLDANFMDSGMPLLLYLIERSRDPTMPACLAVRAGANPVPPTPESRRFNTFGFALVKRRYQLWMTLLSEQRRLDPRGAHLDQIVDAKKGETMLHALCRREERYADIAMLLDMGASAVVRNADGMTAFDLMCSHGACDLATVHAFLSTFADPKTMLNPTGDQRPPLASAILERNWVLADALINNGGADLDLALAYIKTHKPNAVDIISCTEVAALRRPIA